MNLILLSIVIGYLLGCLKGSQLIGKAKHIDIKNSGVKNAGASNTAILLGWKFGLVVALIDIFKPLLAIFILGFISETFFSVLLTPFLLYLTGTCVILGHNYPITMKFKGGKGTASLIGFLFCIDWKIGTISLLSLIIVSLLTDYLIIGVGVMYLSFLLTTFYFHFGKGALVLALCLTLLSIYKHMENIKRIQLKKETKVSSMWKKTSK